ncbi:GNAT family N-acetyltransferase [Bacillus salipaludis]|uniref:GNAT family N-acetyltransferase n=1 Tax=Bacillus salipaludis TaxID=2547811 RepID=A0A4R5VTH4_9BACI|nr:GNAT family N-acetyltransferase [Bacillus salipaludis]TDK61760.1 GNAT family N-acetyltransferase [Bacillus salipaludis]
MSIGVIEFENKLLDLNVRVIDIEKDKDVLIQFRKDTQIQSVGKLDGFDFGSYLNRVRERINKLPNGQLLIEKDNIPVGQMGLGIVDYEGIDIGYVDLFYLIPEYRGKGLGEDLIRYAENFFKEINVYEYQLRVSSANQRAIRLYTNSGLVKISEDNEEHPVWRMRKIL